MRYAEQRRILAQRIANADLLSPDTVARMFGMPLSGHAPRSTAKKSSRLNYEPREEQRVVRLSPIQRDVYRAIRRRAETGEYAPSYEDLMEITGRYGLARETIEVLIRRGLLERIDVVATSNRPRAYRLPLANIETRIWKPKEREA